jgi:RNA polymerase sigma-70 factor (ECF subfamily)
MQEFQEQISNNSTGLLSFIRSFTKNNIHTDDIFQKVCLTIWRRYNDFDKSTEFMLWACTIAKYEIKNYHRAINRCPVRFDSDMYEEVIKFRKTEEQTENEMHEKLNNALKTLDKQTRELLISVYINNEEIKDLAERDGKSSQTYYNKLNLAKKKLKAILNDKATNN